MANSRQRPPAPLPPLGTVVAVAFAIAVARLPGSPSALAMASPPVASSERSAPAASTLAIGRKYSRWFEEGAIDRLWLRLSAGLQKTFGGTSGLVAFRRKVQQAAGRETDVVDERTIPWLRSVIYNRTIQRSDTSGSWWTQWTLSNGHALAFLVQPATTAAPSASLEYRTRTPLRLPFQRTWFVFWGGRTVLENYHAVSAAQRFATDFVVVRAGRTSRGPRPTSNGDYFCFGQPILAPADGAVVEAVGHLPDKMPGRMNEDQPFGNHVVLDHENGEFSFLAHLRQGSLRVRQGQRVRSGDPLGQCGNSGRSSEPHLHYHLQTTADTGGLGLPAQFMMYWADGGSVERGEPRRGQFVAPAAASVFEMTLDRRLHAPSASTVGRHDAAATVTTPLRLTRSPYRP